MEYSRPKFDIHAVLDNTLIEPLRRILRGKGHQQSPMDNDDKIAPYARRHPGQLPGTRYETLERRASINSKDYYREFS